MVNVLPQFQQFAWYFPMGTFVAFVMGAGMGANELSSNWSSVFGARVLKLWQIVILAGFFEFIGAVSIGESVASAIKDGVIDRRQFLTPRPEVLMLAFMVVLISAAIWLIIANYYAVPVSDSQTTVMALVGVGLAYNSASVIVGKSIFERRGLLKIISAWAFSPLSAAIIGMIFYTCIQKFLLVRTVPRALKALPVFIFVVFFINVWFFLLETDLQPWGEELEWWHKLVGGLIGGVVATAILQFTYVSWLTKKIDEIKNKTAKVPFSENSEEFGGKGKSDDETVAEPATGIVGKIEKFLGSNRITSYLVKDYFAEALKDEDVRHAHENAEVYPEEMEFLFSHLLIVTSCFKSFAHGASDVSNTIGPLSGIIEILTTGTTADKASFPDWIKVVGATSMLVGIVTYGWRALVTVGIKLTRLSPAKGLAIDLSAAIVVITTAYLKIPISSTQTQIGAILGVALVSGHQTVLGGTNWKAVMLIAFIWVCNLGISLSLSYGLFNFIARSPKV
jgi:sodium-dependent phosphate transporter